jgi:uncharacterized protein (DUF924 family)
MTDDMHGLLDFWFDVDPADTAALSAHFRRWFASTPDDDRALAERFGTLAHAAAADELDTWSGSPQGRLALILLLDQLPRNLHRGTAAAFAQDPKALALSLGGIELDMHEPLGPLERIFFLMPLQHAESLPVQELSVHLFRGMGALATSGPLADLLQNVADYAVKHRDIIARFGRFPHRNRILGRDSTAEEQAFLDAGGPSFGQ